MTEPLREPPAGVRSIPDCVEYHAKRQGDKTAIIDAASGRALTYSQLRTCARVVALRLRDIGVEAGDRVAILLPNGIEWVVYGLATHYLRAIVVPLNTRFQPPEALYILRKSGARLLVSTSSFNGRDYADEIASSPTRPAGLLVIDVRDPEFGMDRLTDDPIGPQEELWLGASLGALAPNDLSDIMFTSGTTGYPKGAMITHGAGLRAIAVGNRRLLMDGSDRQLIVNPFFHMFGYKHGWAWMLALGATVLAEQKFDARRAAELIQKYAITVFSGPPTLFHSIMELPNWRSYDLSSLRFSLTGSTRVPPEVVHRMHTDMGIDRVGNGFGMTESTALGTFTLPDDDLDTVATTTGRPIDEIELVVRKPDGTDCAPDEAGEILIRGFCVMRGYYGDPEATKAAIDPDGWLHTGDLGSFDSRGNLRIVGRLKDVIIVGGFNVYPAEVERVLAEHPAVSDAALVGHPDERLGEVPVAWVELAAPAEPAELIAWCRERVANFKVPREVVIVNALPRNAMGKVRKAELRRA